MTVFIFLNPYILYFHTVWSSYEISEVGGGALIQLCHLVMTGYPENKALLAQDGSANTG